MRRLVSSAFCAAAGTATSAAPAIIMATKVFVIFGVPLLRLKPDAPCARPDCKEKSCHSGMIERHRRLSPRRHPPILVPCSLPDPPRSTSHCFHSPWPPPAPRKPPITDRSTTYLPPQDYALP